MRRDRGSRAADAPANRQLAPVVDAFNGKTDPGLVMPTQVFGPFVMTVFGDLKTSLVLQKGFTPEVRLHGLPPDFWNRLGGHHCRFRRG